MTGRSLTTLLAAVTAVAFICVGGITALAGAASACPVTGPSGPTTMPYDPDQLHHAQVIVSVGVQRGIPVRGQIIAVATAIQESNLRNLPHLGDRNDHDSLGLFQQRPSQGWGTPDQILNPVHAAGLFYDKLTTIAGWQSMPLTEAAQAVQRSAYPNAYAKWETDATTLVARVGPTIPGAIPGDLGQCMGTAGWVQPVNAPIVSGFRTADRPGHDGVDLGAGRGTPIRAAAAGTVMVVTCDVAPASWGCDQDGNLSTPGCGWYVDIRHAGNVFTRYCHLGARPVVAVGQEVMGGQVIGQVGSSGHSSGPHLHYEVHLGGESSETAVDPIPFMRDRLAPLDAHQ